MNPVIKLKRSVGIMLGAIVVLGATFVILWLGLRPAESKEEGESSASGLKTVTVLPETITQLASMTVENEVGKYSIVPDGEDYRIEELGDLPQDATLVRYVAESTLEMTSSGEIGEVEELSEFGLEKPVITITLRFEDGSEKQLLLGNTVPFEEEERYFCAEGSRYVCIVKVDEHLNEGAQAFVSTKVIQNTTQDGSDVFTTLSLSGSDFPEKLVIQNQDGVYYMQEPVLALVDKEQVDYAAVQLGGLTAKEAVAVRPSAELLSSLGFDSPRTVLEATLNDVPYRIRVAAKDSSTDYVVVDGMDVVYEVLRSNISAWADASRMTLQSKAVARIGIETVQTLTYQDAELNEELTVARTEDESRSTEDKTYYSYQAQSGERVFDTDAYQKLVDAIDNLSLVDFPSPQAGKSEMRISWNTFDGKANELEFIPYEESCYLAVLNGNQMGIVKKAAVESIQKAAQTLFYS